MTAYSFQKRFVEPIRWGLGLGLDLPDGIVEPKRQTIRADRKRHARPGEELQLYCGMRTKGCFLIGKARCTSVLPIVLQFSNDYVNVGGVRAKDVEHFARRDGFKSFGEMSLFWRRNNNLIGGTTFSGVIIFWEPIDV